MRTFRVCLAALVILLIMTAYSPSQTVSSVEGPVPKPESVLWSPAKTTVSRVLEVFDDKPHRARFNSTGEFLALNCDGAVVVRSVSDGKETRRFPSSHPWCNPAWSHKTDDLAFSDTSTSVSVHSAHDGSLKCRITSLPSSVLRLEWSPAGDSLAIGGEDGMLRIVSVLRQAIANSLEVGSETIFSLAYSRSGDRLAIRTQDEALHFWNPTSEVFTRRKENQGLNGTIAYGTTKYALTDAHDISVFNASVDTIAYTIASRFPSTLSFAADESFLVFVEDGSTIVLVESNGQRLHQFRCTTGYVVDMSLSPDSKNLAVVDSNSQVVIWDVSSIAALKAGTLPDLPPEATVKGRYSDVLEILSAPDDRGIFGDLFEFGIFTRTGVSGDAYWVYSAPNWYLFSHSRIGISRPRTPLPEPVDIPVGKRRIWLAFPNAVCSGAFAEAVDRLPASIRRIEAASLTYQHGFTFPDKERNYAIAVLTLDVTPGTDTATVLELLSQKASIIVRDGTVLTETEAKLASVYTTGPIP